VIRVALVASAVAVRTGLNALLGATDAIEVVAEVASLDELDPFLPGIDVLVLASDPFSPADLERVIQTMEGVALLVLTPFESQVARTFSGLPVRAWGLLPLEASLEELVVAIEALHHGLFVGDPNLIEPLLLNSPELTDFETEALDEPLTERETEVLQLLAQGLANKQIALALGISEHTVKFHVSSIYSKLGASNRTEAVRQGIRKGLVLL
jgi:DNA-binding NarL/FixJ family response regulator